MAVEMSDPIKTYPKWQFWRGPCSARKRIVAFIIGLILIGTAGVLAWAYYQPDSETISSHPDTAKPTPTPEPKDHPNPLNGVLYTASEAAAFDSLRPVAVMVENHVLARPQAGLNQADILYEAMAEGGITRFMAVYLANQPEKVGPVRSARLHFINWAAEYDAGYAHWGGSAEALSYLSSHIRPRNLDEFMYASAFWRDNSSGKPLEHTGYTSLPNLREVLSGHGWEAATTFTSWMFKDETKDDVVQAPPPTEQTVKLAFLGTTGYAAEFDYRSATNDYARKTGGIPHLDADGQQLTTKTIVLLYQSVRSYTDDNGHAAVDVTVTGTGKAVVIQDGGATVGSWSKPDTNSRTVLTDASGQNIALDRGKIWVVSVPTGSTVSY
jgi:hypothetical protein